MYGFHTEQHADSCPLLSHISTTPAHTWVELPVEIAVAAGSPDPPAPTLLRSGFPDAAPFRDCISTNHLGGVALSPSDPLQLPLPFPSDPAGALFFCSTTAMMIAAAKPARRRSTSTPPPSEPSTMSTTIPALRLPSPHDVPAAQPFVEAP